MFEKLLDLLRTRGFQKGVIGSSRAWLGVWAGIGAARFLHKRLGKEEVVVERVVLKPGQTVEIRDTGEPWGKKKPGKR